MMTCVFPHDNCPLFEEGEDHLSCARTDCYWTYANPREASMTELICPPCSADTGRGRTDVDPSTTYVCPVCGDEWYGMTLFDSTDAEVLDAAADLIERCGLSRGDRWPGASNGVKYQPDSPCDLWGALRLLTSSRWKEKAALERIGEHAAHVYDWGDEVTQAEVVETLRAVAAKSAVAAASAVHRMNVTYDSPLLDSIRAWRQTGPTGDLDGPV